ncbi:MAG: outer rane efflux protein [Myxococcales bacterium]|nr:outer rane efflux protein [Myxococcales bacterium]
MAALAPLRADAANGELRDLPPQEVVRTVGLREVVALALDHNPGLGAAVADVDFAKGAVTAAKGLDDFVIDAAASWVENRQPLVTGTPVQQPALDDVRLSAQLTRPLSTGGRLGLRLSTEFTRTEFATERLDPMTMAPLGFDRSASTVWAPALQLVFTQPLLRGIGVHTARAQRFRAYALRDVATLNRATTASVLVRDVVSSFWELAYAREELAIRKQSAVSAREQLEIVNANIEVGKQPPSASAEVQVSIALRDEDAILAEQQARERSLDLERLVGLALDARAPRLAAAEKVTPIEAVPGAGEVLEAARKNNPQLRAAYAGERVAMVDVDVTENGMLPQLDMALAGGPTGNATDVSTAFNQLARFQAYALNGSLVLSAPIPNRTARGLRDEARANLHKAKLSTADIKLQLETVVLRLVTQIETARRRIDVLASTTDHAALDLEAERARFAVGRATNFDVLRRQEELATAKLRQARARTDYLKAMAALGAVTSEILDRYEVVMR